MLHKSQTEWQSVMEVNILKIDLSKLSTMFFFSSDHSMICNWSAGIFQVGQYVRRALNLQFKNAMFFGKCFSLLVLVHVFEFEYFVTFTFWLEQLHLWSYEHNSRLYVSKHTCLGVNNNLCVLYDTDKIYL